jgi:toxin ParE1/3/4
MTPIILRKPRVLDDLVHHYAYIAQDKIDPAERFLRVAEESFLRLAGMPSIGTKWPSRHRALAEIHVYPMPSPYRSYLIFYRVVPHGVEILTVLHGARDLEKTLRNILSPD